MASQTKQLALSILLFGCLSFILGIFAELKKPALGTPIPGKGVVICKFPKDPSVALGALSALSVLISSALGILAIYFPYKGKSVPKNALLDGIAMKLFYIGAILFTVTGLGTTIYNTIIEVVVHVRNVHGDLEYTCPTAKTGLFGGAAFLNLDACIFWLVCQMLVGNIREDYFEHVEEDEIKGDYLDIGAN